MTNNKQQTAVEWLIKQLKLLELNKNRISEDAYKSRLSYMVNKAKEMEKERTINDYIEGRNSVINREIIPAKQYYNETYGGGNQ